MGCASDPRETMRPRTCPGVPTPRSQGRPPRSFRSCLSRALLAGHETWTSNRRRMALMVARPLCVTVYLSSLVDGEVSVVLCFAAAKWEVLFPTLRSLAVTTISDGVTSTSLVSPAGDYLGVHKTSMFNAERGSVDLIMVSYQCFSACVSSSDCAQVLSTIVQIR